MPIGVNGFRAWTEIKVPAGLIRCPCGWSGLPHYALREYVEASKGKCVSGNWEQLEEAVRRLDSDEFVRRFLEND